MSATQYRYAEPVADLVCVQVERLPDGVGVLRLDLDSDTVTARGACIAYLRSPSILRLDGEVYVKVGLRQRPGRGVLPHRPAGSRHHPGLIQPRSRADPARTSRPGASRAARCVWGATAWGQGRCPGRGHPTTSPEVSGAVDRPAEGRVGREGARSTSPRPDPAPELVTLRGQIPA